MDDNGELKVGDQVKLLSKQINESAWHEFPEYGIIRQMHVNKGEIPIFCKVLFQKAANPDLYDILPINSLCSKLVKFGGRKKKKTEE